MSSASRRHAALDDLARCWRSRAGSSTIVELGTATGAGRRSRSRSPHPAASIVLDFDRVSSTPSARAISHLAGASVLERIELVSGLGETGPRGVGRSICCSSIARIRGSGPSLTIRAWRRAHRAGSVVVLDDYAHPDDPDVREAIEELERARPRRAQRLGLARAKRLAPRSSAAVVAGRGVVAVAARAAAGGRSPLSSIGSE